MANPTTPQDYAEAVPGPNAPQCEALYAVLHRGAELDYLDALYQRKADGTLSEAFKNDLCALACAGSTTGPGTGPGDPTIAFPTSVSATDGAYSDRVVITWAKVMGATGYSVWRGASSNVNGAAQIGSVTGEATLTFTDNDADPGVTYFYFVKTLTSAGVSQFSASDTGYASAT